MAMEVFAFAGQKVIKPGWFDHEYCGLALGYSRNHQSRLSYVRCVICKRDIKVSNRRITTFFENCRGLRHHRLDCIVRLARGMPLLRHRDKTLMTSDEAAECRTEYEGVSVPKIEMCPSYSVSEVFELEVAARAVWEEEQYEEAGTEQTMQLFVWLVLDAIYQDCQFTSVTNLWDVMVTFEPQHAALFGQKCQLSDVMVMFLIC